MDKTLNGKREFINALLFKIFRANGEEENKQPKKECNWVFDTRSQSILLTNRMRVTIKRSRYLLVVGRVLGVFKVLRIMRSFRDKTLRINLKDTKNKITIIFNLVI